MIDHIWQKLYIADTSFAITTGNHEKHFTFTYYGEQA